ncbi:MULTISPECIES: tRNA lysidine(34) synthetase TilS [Pantoea]|jgi:tRNA(Ile)-lysidine synthase|uniref:tRNA lysidine(34) synthetase TilS n=1 Tax=Pantoea TaxID=53335 RepID=UPI001F45B2CE|nr:MULTISPECIES: tRNA lysidine(34) synthetase TilS [Pantoea]UIL51789.1 tRNA lysidine(34) synthetase TilS [Pantoea agglomerans]
MSLSALDSLLQPDAALVVAFSGGLDSTVLLHQAWRWQQHSPQSRLRALHVHHGLSPNADRWAAHCLALCQQWQLPCEVLRVRIDSRDSGIEAAARTARYQALSAALQPGETLLTAQHLDDQCETFLLALKRGSGPAGLAAMPPSRMLGAHRLLRPLLNHSRQSLEHYARTHQLVWVEDESNQDLRYDRNFLRQRLLPELSQRWPHFAEATARSAALCAEQEQLLDELLAEQLAALTQPDGSLHFPPLLTMSEARANALLRRWIAGQGGSMPSRDALNRIRHEVMASREDAQPRLQSGQAELRRYRQQLYWLPRLSSLRDIQLAWPDISQPLALPDNLGLLQASQAQRPLRLPQPDEQISVRFHAQGQVHLAGRSGGREMKKLWQALHIPPWQRERIPLIFYNQTLICAPDLFITREGAAIDSDGWQVVWHSK